MKPQELNRIEIVCECGNEIKIFGVIPKSYKCSKCGRKITIFHKK